jgi:hypothetical protein
LVRADDCDVIVSPIRGLAETLTPDPTRPTVFLAPNYFHYLGLAEWLAHRDGSTAAATETAARRIGKKSGVECAPIESLAERLPAGVELLEPPGLKSGESWLSIELADGRRAWVVSDAFFALEANARGFTGFMLWLTGTAPGLRIGRTFTGLALADKKAYKAWLLDQIAADRPRVLIPAHGAIVDDDSLDEQLAAVANSRL